jgi:hypothetical protein
MSICQFMVQIEQFFIQLDYIIQSGHTYLNPLIDFFFPFFMLGVLVEIVNILTYSGVKWILSPSYFILQ